MCFYSNSPVLEWVSPEYKYEVIEEYKPLPESKIGIEELIWTDREYENKVGVFITCLPEYPHSSLMAFLSTEDDEIFLIAMKHAFKSKVLHSNNHSCFAIDHRANFVFERAYDWNYTIIDAQTYMVSRENPVFKIVQERFVEKNPWEASFFLSPDVEMYHLKPMEILMSDTQFADSALLAETTVMP